MNFSNLLLFRRFRELPQFTNNQFTQVLQNLELLMSRKHKEVTRRISNNLFKNGQKDLIKLLIILMLVSLASAKWKRVCSPYSTSRIHNQCGKFKAKLWNKMKPKKRLVKWKLKKRFNQLLKKSAEWRESVQTTKRSQQNQKSTPIITIIMTKLTTTTTVRAYLQPVVAQGLTTV